jgi:hypothetical protein
MGVGDIEWNYTLIKTLKYFFINNSGISKYESYKIWSNWIITQSLEPAYNSFPPKLDSYKETIIQNIVDKGGIMNETIIFIELFQKQLESIRPLLIKRKENMQVSIDGGEVKYKSICHKVLPNLLLKLQNSYMRGMTTRLFKENLLELLNCYDLLDGLSYQWSIPDGVYNAINSYLPIDGELFASPMNNKNNNYWSLFPVDKLFGSNGNFFHIKKLDDGVYIANPPFIEKLFIRSSEIILDMFGIGKYTFVYFMPNWLDSKGYDLLTKSPFYITQLIIKGNTHYYYESTHNKYIKVHFDTHVLFLSNIVSLIPDSLKLGIKRGFSIIRT